jgi:hypothetical protein
MIEVLAMEQKVPLSPFPPGFPSELAAEAFVQSGEASWRPQLAITSIEWLGTHGYAVLGTEVFMPQRGATQSLPYFQTVDRGDDEEWNSFVTRAAEETIVYLRTFQLKFAAEGDVYINLTWAAEPEFQNLKPM